jgi:hypothetical protein
MIRKEEVHFCGRFSFWRELENNAHAINNELFTGEGDVKSWCNESRRTERNKLAKPTVNVPSGTRWQQRPKLVTAATTHCRASNNVFANGFMQETNGGNDQAMASINSFLCGDSENPSEMINV